MAHGSVEGTELADGVLDSVDPARDRPTLRERRNEAWVVAIVAIAAVVGLVVAQVNDGGVFVDLAVVVLGFLVVVVCGAISLVKVFRFRVPGLVGLAAVVAWFVLMTTGVPLDPPSDPFRGRTLWADRTAAEAMLARSASAPSKASGSGSTERPTDGRPFVMTDGRAAVVGWLEGGGFGPGRGAGLVYDPNGALAAGSRFRGVDGVYVVQRSSCDHRRGPWYWCRLA
ncbi:MAG: hypothetical protein ACTHN0_03860 [Aquihabitans sp.]